MKKKLLSTKELKKKQKKAIRKNRTQTIALKYVVLYAFLAFCGGFASAWYVLT